jgi:hypothetical protein
MKNIKLFILFLLFINYFQIIKTNGENDKKNIETIKIKEKG